MLLKSLKWDLKDVLSIIGFYFSSVFKSQSLLQQERTASRNSLASRSASGYSRLRRPSE